MITIVTLFCVVAFATVAIIVLWKQEPTYKLVIGCLLMVCCGVLLSQFDWVANARDGLVKALTQAVKDAEEANDDSASQSPASASSTPAPNPFEGYSGPKEFDGPFVAPVPTGGYVYWRLPGEKKGNLAINGKIEPPDGQDVIEYWAQNNDASFISPVQYATRK